MKLEFFDKPVAVEQQLFEVNPQRVEGVHPPGS